MIKIEKLKDLKNGKYYLAAHCEECGHSNYLNIEVLAKKFGESFEIPEIKNHLYCKKCKSKNVVTKIGWAGGNALEGAHKR